MILASTTEKIISYPNMGYTSQTARSSEPSLDGRFQLMLYIHIAYWGQYIGLYTKAAFRLNLPPSPRIMAWPAETDA
jgi:hypothetical protein